MSIVNRYVLVGFFLCASLGLAAREPAPLAVVKRSFPVAGTVHLARIMYVRVEPGSSLPEASKSIKDTGLGDQSIVSEFEHSASHAKALLSDSPVVAELVGYLGSMIRVFKGSLDTTMQASVLLEASRPAKSVVSCFNFAKKNGCITLYVVVHGYAKKAPDGVVNLIQALVCDDSLLSKYYHRVFQFAALGVAWLAGRASVASLEGGVPATVPVPAVQPVAPDDHIKRLKEELAAELDARTQEILQSNKREVKRAAEKLLLELGHHLRRKNNEKPPVHKKFPRGGVALAVAQALKSKITSEGHTVVSESFLQRSAGDADDDEPALYWRILAPFSEDVAHGRSAGLTPERVFDAIKTSRHTFAAKRIAVFNLSDFGTFAEFNPAADFRDDRASLLSVLYAFNSDERSKIPDAVKDAWVIYIIDDITMPGGTSYSGILEKVQDVFGEKTSLLDGHRAAPAQLAEAIFRLNKH